MTEIRLYNTLTRRKEVFTPADPKRVTMYVCGPTVYNRAHIGNARAAVVFDVLFRLLRHVYGADHVVYARNITDIDDKIIAESQRRGVDPQAVAAEFEAHYAADMAALGCLPPTLTPHATHHVGDMIAMIAALVREGVAYEAAGEVLFEVARYPDYGRLSGRTLDQMLAGARVEVAANKRSPGDFVLWKPSKNGEPGWDSPWGRGRPGWHIECSAMIDRVLGRTIDIHGGGLDLIFPHHENEIAQSACAHDGAPLAKLWMHNGFLSMGADKMSKSLGNVVTVEELLADGWHGEIIRSGLLSAHYRQPLIWNANTLSQQKVAVSSLYGVKATTPCDVWYAAQLMDCIRLAHNALLDDLNTPAMFASLYKFNQVAANLNAALVDEMIAVQDRELFIQARVTMFSYVVTCSTLLGMLAVDAGVFSSYGTSTMQQQHVAVQIDNRAIARARKDWAESDRIRDELAAQGIVLEDGPTGTTWRRA